MNKNNTENAHNSTIIKEKVLSNIKPLTEKQELNLKKECLYISNDNKTFIKRIGELKKGSIIITLLEGVNGYFIEWINGDNIKEIGLTIKNKRVMDYDGVYFLNEDIVYLLRKCGFIVNTKEVLK